ncbi:MAG TPA: SLC13/DASS family transporter [Epsilonproteobacteria bacterium]|nr:SLC13/DASS family transporter [Campylobacterota bacterium]
MGGIWRSIIIGCLIFVLGSFFVSPIQALLLGIIGAMVVLWTNGALPLGVVSLLPLILFPISSIADFTRISSQYANPIIFLFLGGFMVAFAMEKTQLHAIIASQILSRFPQSPAGIIYGVAIASALLSAILSNTTVVLMLLPVVMHLTEIKVLRVRILLAAAYGASIGGILTPIGTPPNLILMGFLSSEGENFLFFGEWIVYMLPVVILMLVIIPWILSRGVVDVKYTFKATTASYNPTQKRLLKILGLLVASIAINTLAKQLDMFALDEPMILLAFGLLMFLPRIGFLNWDDTRNLPYEIIFLFGAGFSIAFAFMESGLASQIATWLSFATQIPFVLLLLLIAFVVTFMTEVTSNTALVAMMIPVVYTIGHTLAPQEANALLLVATIAGSYAFMLPIATPPNAIVMATREIEVRQMIKIGFLFNLIGITVLVAIASLFWS